MLFIDKFNDLQITILEERMRCSPHKPVCYLGKGENVKDTIHEDAEVLRQLGVTHTEIARALADIMTRQSVTMRTVEQPLECPFELGTVFLHSNQEFTIRIEGEEITFAGILLHMIAAHQFFGGKGSPYRLEPAKAARLLRVEGIAPRTAHSTPA